MQGIFDSLQSAVANSTSTGTVAKVVGISVPLLGITCNTKFVIDPITDIKKIVSRLYNYLLQSILNPVWTALYALYNALKRFGLAILDLKLPVLNLHISDLFDPNLYEKIKAAVTELYHKGKDKLLAILKTLGIPFPFFINIQSIELEIEALVEKIFYSLMGLLFQKIEKILTIIEIGLEAYDLITYGIPTLSLLLKNLIKTVLGKIIDLLINPPTIQQIHDALVAFAKKLYNKAEVTYQELINAIQHFKLPIIGFPLDWVLPINIRVSIPNVDFEKLLTDMKNYINNFCVNLIKKFIREIAKILSIFNINFTLPIIPVPFGLCYANQSGPIPN